jgi:hypothetical protein
VSEIFYIVVVVCSTISALGVLAVGGSPSAWDRLQSEMTERAKLKSECEIEKKRIELKMLDGGQ